MTGDAFSTLGLSPRFDLEPAEVERAYLARCAGVHPDLARGDPEAARAMASLNSARRVLADAERRADALLLALGGPSREGEKGLPAGFLAGMMETREAIESAVSASDGTARARERARWEAWAADQRRQGIAEVGGMFAALGTPPAPAALRDLRIRLNAWRYLERLIEQLDPQYDPQRADFSDPR